MLKTKVIYQIVQHISYTDTLKVYCNWYEVHKITRWLFFNRRKVLVSPLTGRNSTLLCIEDAEAYLTQYILGTRYGKDRGMVVKVMNFCGEPCDQYGKVYTPMEKQS